MNKRAKGIIFVMGAGAIFGFTPILARLVYAEGVSSITVIFLRGLLALPFLFLLMKGKGISFSIREDWKMLLLAGGLGQALCTILLYMAYDYIPVGMAAALHFTYPVWVAVGCILIFREKLTGWKLAALVLCTLGVSLFLEQGDVSLVGVVLAVLSGAAYALYMVAVDKSGLKHMHYLKMAFYINVFMSVGSGLYGAATGQLTLGAMTPRTWILCLMIALLIAVGAIPLIQLGIREIGATTAAILSTVEPITSNIFSVLILHEVVSANKLLGCAAILLSILIISLGGRKPAAGAE